ncbi:dipeptidyl aminopeptidase-like protein 6 [Homalodisca vitripennis]|uniref:dipeptidyl aminopeptidase-like protein 6 n=1 Tax=Homalodisca vitripennis TaxID=197043 RepID=UPI001EEB2453|nr:dipeptidyl aminopeptidase-like protein 6 [Homalodisca vitripennis]XP_046680411.1 dipeptidyl aminopeptidase-like protein 6 [Homalodisca vitripennis]
MSDTAPEPPPVKPPPPEPRKAYPKVVTFVTHKEELVSSTPNVRNWRGMLIALLVIVAVLGLILFSIVLLSPPDEGPRVQGTKFTLDHITSSIFKTTPFNGSWVSETEVVYRDMHGGLSVYNAHNNTVRVLMTNSTFVSH